MNAMSRTVLISLMLSWSAQAWGKGMEVDVETTDGNHLIGQFMEVTPSQKGTKNLSLTKAPKDDLDAIVWESFSISRDQEDAPEGKITSIAEIRLTGAPLTYKYAKFSNDFLFYPIEITLKDGSKEVWHLHGAEIILQAGDVSTRKSTSLAKVRAIRFLATPAAPEKK
jgi:hypothetical protein